MTNEWASDDPRAPLDIPPELLARQRYRFSTPKDFGLVGTCASYEFQLHGVVLVDVLVDTSQRIGGTTMKKRVTHRPELIFAMTPVVIFPLHETEAGQ